MDASLSENAFSSHKHYPRQPILTAGMELLGPESCASSMTGKGALAAWP
jgi:hypothetical protein